MLFLSKIEPASYKDLKGEPSNNVGYQQSRTWTGAKRCLTAGRRHTHPNTCPISSSQSKSGARPGRNVLPIGSHANGVATINRQAGDSHRIGSR